jgi:tetraprenyl-beta-curcumene synthase
MGITRELSVYPRLLTRILPLVERELRGWRDAARTIPDADLRRQALASLERKKFHCVGGSVLALMGEGRALMGGGLPGVGCDRERRCRETPQARGRGRRGARHAEDTVAELVRAIVAIQTISDYLDNLCDRSMVAARVAGSSGCAGWPAGQLYRAYLQLHESMLCAVDLERPAQDYYRGYLQLIEGLTEGLTERLTERLAGDLTERLAEGSGKSLKASPDGGYLDALVETSRETLRKLQGYAAARPFVVKLVSLYSELQAAKHLPSSIRDEVMERWFRARYLGLAQPIWPDQQANGARLDLQPNCTWPDQTPGFDWTDQPPEPWLRQSDPSAWLGRDLHWWEFGAATGSTLAMFALLCASTDPALTPGQARTLATGYFPAICGLHILLDYYIDQAEDVEGGDLNFVSHYTSASGATRALESFTRWSIHEAQRCAPFPWLHTAVVRGLLAMYLSDPKVGRQGLGGPAFVLTRAGQGITPPLRTACSLARKILKF